MTATATDGDRAVRPATADTRSAARRVRGVVLWALALVVGGALIALAAGRPSPDEYLHPDGTGQTGARALVEVLRDQGVDVEVVETTAEALAAGANAPGTTVVVGNSSLLGETAARDLLRGSRDGDGIVLLDGAPQVLYALGLSLDALPATDDVGPASCSARWVRPDDELRRVSWALVGADEDGASTGGLPPGATGCYEVASGSGDDAPPPGHAAVLVPGTADRAPVTVVGFPDAATNRFVTEADHAGLVVRLLGASPRLVWFHPNAEALAAGPDQGSEPVAPSFLVPATAVLALAVLAFALARGRRLGRLVPERLPVVVRGTETTESRAAMYRAASDRGRAAAVLRRASTTRLASRLGLPAHAPLPTVVAATAAATGLAPSEVDAVLRDSVPPDEAALVRLAQQLTRLEEKVSTP